MITSFWLLWLHGIVTFFGYIATLWVLAGVVAKIGYWTFLQIDRALTKFLDTRERFWDVMNTIRLQQKGGR